MSKNSKVEQLEELALRLLRVFRAHQRLARYVGSAYGTDVSTTEGYILMELEARPELSVVTLAEILQLNKATVSRSIQNLVDGAYLGAHESPDDGRRKVLSLLKKGKEFLALHRTMSLKLVTNLARNLNIADRTKLLGYLSAFADADGALPMKIGKDVTREMAILLQMRRLARSHGITGLSFFQSGYSSTTWQILSSISYDPPPHRPTVIAQSLSLRRNTVSQIMKRFVKDRWISLKDDSTDGRAKTITLLPRGRQILKMIEAAALERLKVSLEALPTADREIFVDLFERHVGLRSKELSVVDTDESVIRRSSDEQELSLLRAQVIESAVTAGKHRLLPQQICAEQNMNFGLWNEDVVEAAVEISTRSGPTLCSIGFSTEPNRETRATGFVLAVIRQVCMESRTRSVFVPKSVQPFLPALLASLVHRDAIAIDSFGDLELEIAVSQLTEGVEAH